MFLDKNTIPLDSRIKDIPFPVWMEALNDIFTHQLPVDAVHLNILILKYRLNSNLKSLLWLSWKEETVEAYKNFLFDTYDESYGPKGLKKLLWDNYNSEPEEDILPIDKDLCQKYIDNLSIDFPTSEIIEVKSAVNALHENENQPLSQIPSKALYNLHHNRLDLLRKEYSHGAMIDIEWGFIQNQVDDHQHKHCAEIEDQFNEKMKSVVIDETEEQSEIRAKRKKFMMSDLKSNWMSEATLKDQHNRLQEAQFIINNTQKLI